MKFFYFSITTITPYRLPALSLKGKDSALKTIRGYDNGVLILKNMI